MKNSDPFQIALVIAFALALLLVSYFVISPKRKKAYHSRRAHKNSNRIDDETTSDGSIVSSLQSAPELTMSIPSNSPHDLIQSQKKILQEQRAALRRKRKLQEAWYRTKDILERFWARCETEQGFISRAHFELRMSEPTSQMISQASNLGIAELKPMPDITNAGRLSDLIGLIEKPDFDQTSKLHYLGHAAHRYSKTTANIHILKNFQPGSNASQQWRKRPCDPIQLAMALHFGVGIRQGATHEQAVELLAQARIATSNSDALERWQDIAVLLQEIERGDYMARSVPPLKADVVYHAIFGLVWQIPKASTEQILTTLRDLPTDFKASNNIDSIFSGPPQSLYAALQ